MGYEFRLLRSGKDAASPNMGLDEAILRSVAARKSPPTLRLYAWEPAAISIGYFQGAREEVDVEACAAQGVQLVRRITGGGAVFHADELTYSLAIPEGHPLAPPSILESYRVLCGGIVAGLTELGVEAAFAPINDIVCGGRKISGNAQTRKAGCLLQHGTILLGVDVEKMFSLLRVPREKALGKLISEAKERVTSLEEEAYRRIEFDEAADALEKGFVSALGLDLKPSLPFPDELEEARRLADEKFSTPAWTFRR